MPQDYHGNELKPGDAVIIHAKIKEIDAHPQGGAVCVVETIYKTAAGMRPPTRTIFAVDPAQLSFDADPPMGPANGAH